MTVFLPKASHPIVGGAGLADPVHYRWMFSVTQALNSAAQDTPEEVAQTKYMQGAGIAITGSDIKVIGLRLLDDSGAGTFKLLARDEYGRLSGTQDGSAADVPYDNATSGLAATDVQAAVDELQAEKLGDAPSDGSEYVRKDGAWEVASAGAGGAMTLAGSATVAGSAATTLTVSGLDLAADGSYVIQANLGNATASDATVSLFFNGDTTATNYYYQLWVADGAGTNQSRTNAATLIALAASASASIVADLMPDILSSYPRSIIRASRKAPAGVELVNAAHIRNNGANVTSITVSSSVANSLAIGSFVKVFKVG